MQCMQALLPAHIKRLSRHAHHMHVCGMILTRDIMILAHDIMILTHDIIILTHDIMILTLDIMTGLGFAIGGWQPV